MNWDASFALRADPSGRCAGVHDAAYDENFVADTIIGSGEPSSKKAKTN
jgi:asparagine synthase (glutamine-hydrolysing)